MALYAIALNFDKFGTVSLFQYICGSYMHEHKIRPHLTLGMFESDNEEDMLVCFKAFAESIEPVRIKFNSVGSFGSSVIYIEPQINAVLRRNFEKTYAEFYPFFKIGDNGNYLPDRWIPHTAVGLKLTQENISLRLSDIQTL